MDYFETITVVTPFMIFIAVVFFGVLFFKEWRESRKRDYEFRMKEFEFRKTEKHEPINNIVVENQDLSEARDSGGYVTLKIDEERKSIFHDLLKGFEEYAAIKGYKASVSVDSSEFGKIYFKITIEEFGITSSSASVKRDLDEYINSIQSGNVVDDLPRVLDEISHAKLSMVLKNRIVFLQQNYEIEKNIREFYEQFIHSLPKGAIAHSVPTIQINSGNLGMDQRKYEANNSANIMQGDNHSNLLEGNTINIGSSHSERSEILDKLDSLLAAIENEGTSSINGANRHIENIKEELEESETPDKGRIVKWLGKAKSILSTAKKGTEVFEKAKEVYESFGAVL